MACTIPAVIRKGSVVTEPSASSKSLGAERGSGGSSGRPPVTNKGFVIPSATFNAVALPKCHRDCVHANEFPFGGRAQSRLVGQSMQFTSGQPDSHRENRHRKAGKLGI